MSRPIEVRPASAAFDTVSAVLFVGVLVFVASLPIVTVLGAGAAGGQLLREYAEVDATPSVHRFLSVFGTALRDPVGLLAPVAVLAAAGLDVLAVLGGLPGATLIGPLLAVALTWLGLCSLRGSVRWAPGRPWRAVLAETAPVVAHDWRGSLMLVVALAIVALIVSQAVGFVVVVPGLLVLAALAVECRRRRV